MDAPRYRIGNTLTVLWSICNNDGTPFDLSSRDIKLFFTNSRGATQIEDYTIVENGDSGLYNIIRWEYSGDDQKTLGDHTLTIEIYPSGSNRKIKRDVCKAFCLVSRSESEESGGEGNIFDSGSLILSSNLDVYRFGRASVEIGTNGNWYIDGFDTGKSALAGGPGLVKNIYNESDLSREFDKNSVIDTFNADTIKKIYDALKGFTMKDITDLSIADLETNDIVAFNGDNWVSIPFKTLFDIYRRTEFVSIAGESGGDGYWYFDEVDGMVHIDKDIYVHGNILLDGDEASMGRGQDTPGGGGGTVDATLEDLSDVEFSNLSDGDTIIFDTESGFWKNVPLKDAGAQEAVDKLSDLLNEMWRLEEGVIVANKPVWLKSNLFIDGDEASTGDGEDNSKGTVRGIKVSSGNTLFPETDGIVDMTEFFSELNFDVDLSGYYTSKQVDELLSPLAKTTYVDEKLSGYVVKERTITAGTGLSGGGDLSADRTISLATVGKAGTYAKVVVDAYGRVTGSASLVANDIPTIAISKVSGLQDALNAKVGLEGEQTITGSKTFSALATFKKGMSIKGDVTIDGNLFITGEEASMGEGGSGTGGGMNVTELENYLKNNDYLFGSINGGREANVYAPTSGGTSGQVLVATGSGAPLWADVNTLGVLFEGGVIKDDIWFANLKGIVSDENNRYNVLRYSNASIKVGDANISEVYLNASNFIQLSIGDISKLLFANDAIYVEDTMLFGGGELPSVTNTIPYAFVSNDNVLIHGHSVHFKDNQGGFYSCNGHGFYEVDSQGVESAALFVTDGRYAELSGSLLLKPNELDRDTLVSIELDGTKYYIGIDSKKSLTYRGFTVLHSGNYTDFIESAEGDSLFNPELYYTKEDIDSNFLSTLGGTVSGSLWVEGSIGANSVLRLYDSTPAAYGIRLFSYNNALGQACQWQISQSDVLRIGEITHSLNGGQFVLDREGNVNITGSLGLGSSSRRLYTDYTSGDLLYEALGVANTVIHSGNIGDYAGSGETVLYWTEETKTSLKSQGIKNGTKIVFNTSMDGGVLNFSDILPEDTTKECWVEFYFLGQEYGTTASFTVPVPNTSKINLFYSYNPLTILNGSSIYRSSAYYVIVRLYYNRWVRIWYGTIL